MPNTQTTFQSFKTVFGFTSVSLSTILFLNYGKVNASTIKITDTNPTYSASVPECFGGGGSGMRYVDCKSNAYLNTTVIKGADAVQNGSEFKKSFDAFNAKNAANQQWKLANGGELNAIFEVSTFDAFATPSVGGVEIKINFDYNGADKADFFWSQGLYLNYTVSPSASVAPFYTMDDNTFNGVNEPNLPPLYPYQYADKHFYDKPTGFWPNDFFNAQTFISKVDYTNRVLTIYDGVSWGYKLSVPEPSAGIPSFMAVIGLMALVRRNRQSNNS